jgi:beta-lactam-binding protein with PASTA domain
VTLGPGDVVADRYEPIRLLGGGEAGRVYVAYDRHLGREVALRLVDGNPAAAATLLEEGRVMSAVQPHLPAAVAVLDAGEIPGGGAYTATELVIGAPLEEVARRAPLPPAEATAHAVALLDAGISARRHAAFGSDVVVASGVLTPEGALRVTRFARAGAPGPAGAEPAVAETAELLRDMLAGGRIPPDLGATIDDALAGRIRTAPEMRDRLTGAAATVPIARVEPTPTAVMPPPPPTEEPGRRWPWVVAGLVALLIAAGVAALLLLGDDDPTVAVPVVAGQTAAQAVATLRDAGLSPQTAGQTSAEVARGVVIGTVPPAGDEVAEGTRITVTVSQGSGEAVVPALAGLTRDQAEAALADAGLTGRVLEAASDTVPAGGVVSQDPAAGLRIPVGSAVVVTVSTGAAPARVPDLTGLTQAQAAAALSQAGLAAGQATQEIDDSVPPGTIVSQDPPAGSEAARGAEVDVVVAAASATTTG